MARRPLLLCVLAAAGLLFSACDKGGIHPLGSSKDVVVPCVAHSTWIRSKEHPSLKNGEPIIETVEGERGQRPWSQKIRKRSRAKVQ